MFPQNIILGNFAQKIPYLSLECSSLKFHAFFCIVLLKGEVFGKVDHFYWKVHFLMYCKSITFTVSMALHTGV